MISAGTGRSSYSRTASIVRAASNTSLLTDRRVAAGPGAPEGPGREANPAIAGCVLLSPLPRFGRGPTRDRLRTRIPRARRADGRSEHVDSCAASGDIRQIAFRAPDPGGGRSDPDWDRPHASSRSL